MNRCEHVIIFGLDAIGTYIRDAHTPNIDRIFGDGASTYRALCSPCTGSPEGWGSIFTGAAPRRHGLYCPLYANDKTRPCPTVFSYIRAAMPNAVMGSFCEWYDLNDHMFEPDIGIDMRNLHGDDLARQTIDFLTEQKPTLMFAYYEIPDDMGHTYGFGTVPFFEGITKCDDYVGQIYAAAESAGMTKENTLFIVVGDHGGINYAHGGMHDLEKYVYFAAAGCGVEHAELGDINVRDTAAVVLHALGIALPSFDTNGWTAQIPAGLFSDGSGADYQPVVVPHRNCPADLPRNTAPIPFGAENGIGGLFGDGAPKLALLFDKTLADAAGNYETVPCYADGAPITERKYGGKGIRHVPGGVRGDAILYDRDGYLSIPDFKVGDGSFTAAFWFRLEHDWYRTQSYDTVFSNKSYADMDSDGICMRIGDSTITFLMKSGDAAVKFGRHETSVAIGAHNLPEDFDGGWMHLTVVLDRENRQYRLYCGFEEIGTCEIPDCFDGLPLDGCGDLRIGYELPPMNTNAITNQYMMDDFLWFDRALTEDEIARLREYYR